MHKSLNAVRHTLLALLLASSFIPSSRASVGGPVAYESFSDPVGRVLGQNGGAGFNEPWQTATGARIAATGLTKSGLYSRGAAATTDGDNLPTTRDLSANLGSVNGSNTVYISFLARVNPNNSNNLGPGSSTYAGLSLLDRGDERLFLGMPFEQANWGFDRAGSGVTSSGDAINGTTRLLVYRIDFTATDSDIRLYVDPTVGGAEPTTASAQQFDTPPFSFNRLRIQSGTMSGGPQIDFDELRIGPTFASVTSNAETPTTYESFDYSGDRLVGQNGGYGFANPWGGIPAITAPGLRFGNLVQAGNKVTTGGGNIGAIRLLTDAQGAVNGAGTIYLSFLARLSPDNQQPIGAGSGTYGGLSLFDNDDERIYVGMFFESDVWSLARSGVAGESSSATVDTNTRLLVLRMDFSGSGTADLRLYVDPTVGGDEPVTPAIQLLGVPDFSFNRIRVQSGGQTGGPRMDFDEIRVGFGYSDVLPTGVSVSGQLNFLEIDPSAGERLVRFEFRPAGPGLFQTALVGADGTYTLTGVPENEYALLISAPTYLSRMISVDTFGGDVSGVDASLLGGDANGDNFVDVFDLDLFIQAFDSIENTPQYLPGADFNGDGSVDVFDLNILILNFDDSGDF